MSRVPAHALLTDNQWAHLRRWLPAPAALGRPITRPRRELLDAIAWRVRTGAPWRFLPEVFGPWQTAYWLFRTWQLAGIWPMLLKALLALRHTTGQLTWTVSVDSTVARAHQHAAGAGRRPVPEEPDDHALGLSKGGRSTKIHLALDTSQSPLAMTLTSGRANDSPQFQVLLDQINVGRHGPGRPRTRPTQVLADRAYTARTHRIYLRERGIKAVIAEKSNQIAARKKRGRHGGRPPAFDSQAYKERNTIERYFNRLKRFRAVATRYDKLAVRYEATIQIAIILDWKP